MEPARAKEIIRSLADGRDPASGQPFPPESPYQEAQTVRALYMALEALERPTGSRTARPIDPNKPKIGANWTPEEEQQLRDAFNAQKAIAEIASAHGRTPGAITARLVKLGLIADSNLNRGGRGNAPAAGLSRRSPPAAETHQGNRPLERQHTPPPATPAELTQDEKDNLPF